MTKCDDCGMRLERSFHKENWAAIPHFFLNGKILKIRTDAERRAERKA